MGAVPKGELSAATRPKPLPWTEPVMPTETGNVITLMFVIGNGGRTLHTIVSSLTLYNGHKVFPNIHSDAERVEPIWDRP